MRSAEELFRAADPVVGSEYVPADLDAMCTRVLDHNPKGRVHATSRRFGTKLSISVALALAVGGSAVGTELALGSSRPSAKAELNRQLNSVVTKYGRAVSTKSSVVDCTTIGATFAQGMLAEGAPAPTLVGNWGSDVAALDRWLFNQAVPSVPATNALEIQTDFNAITDGSAPTSVCYFLGQYGQQLSTPISPHSSGSLGVQIVLVVGTKAYGQVTLPYPIPAPYEVPPAA